MTLSFFALLAALLGVACPLAVWAPADPESAKAEPSHLTRDELARRYQVSVRTVDAALAAGTINAVRYGRAVRFPIAEVHRVDAEGFTV